jgi:16S rRNA (adenine(1408)-N(1))-methyltransferase
VIDVGAGDGHATIRLARTEPRTLAIALDASFDRMRDGARIAQKRTLANALFVVSSIEAAPRELDRTADEISINFPWGSLLRGIVRAEPSVLQPLARLARPSAPVRILLSVEERDGATGLAALDTTRLARNASAYAAAGFGLSRCTIATPAERACGSSWSKRLSADRQVLALTLRRDR